MRPQILCALTTVVLSLGSTLNTYSQPASPAEIQKAIKALKAEEEMVRIKAAHRLGEYRDTAEVAIPHLFEILRTDASGLISYDNEILKYLPGSARYGDSGSKVMIQGALSQVAAISLGKIGAASILPLTKNLQEDDSDIVYYTAIALASIEEGSGVEFLTEKLQNPDYPYRHEISYNLRFSPGEEAMQALIACASEPDAGLRLNAARFLDNWYNVKAMETLILLLQDEDANIRESAASSLDNWNDKRAIEALLSALQDPEDGVRRRASQSLNGISGRSFKPIAGWETWWEIQQLPDHIREPIEMLESYNMDKFMTAACRVREIAEEAAPAIPLLMKRMGVDDRKKYYAFDRKYLNCLPTRIEYREADEEMLEAKAVESFGAASILAKIGIPAVEPLSKELYKDKKGQTEDVYYAAVALSVMGSEEAVAALERAFFDPGVAYRTSISDALMFATSEKAMELVIRTMDDQDVTVRINAAGNLPYWDDVRAMGALIRGLNDEHFMVRQNSVKGLAGYKDDRAIDALISALDNEMEMRQVLEAIFASLTKLTGEDFGDNAKKWVKWWKKRER